VVAADSGQLAVFDVSGRFHPQGLAGATADPEAHSVAVDPPSHLVYLLPPTSEAIPFCESCTSNSSLPTPT